jgi:alpha-L-fucosidase
MKTSGERARLLVLLLAVGGGWAAQNGTCADVGADHPAATAQQTYQPTWDSLTRHPVPEWYRDAKFGIYCHWSAFSVPAFGNEWYSRTMYQKGSPENLHHLKTYGSLATFGYKDFIPLFKAEKFDADQWAELFEKAGAKFAGPVTEHADGFSLWDSKLTKWNAALMGPRRDVVGELERAIRHHGMKFIATFHHQWLWAWYPTEDKSVDASNPAYAGLYGPPVPASAFAGDVYPRPSKPFCDLWEAKIEEVIDKYHPDLIYFDARANTIDESHRRNFLAYYYNRAHARDQQVIMTYKDKDFAVGSGVVDLERGRMARGMAEPWQTDDSIDWNSWCDIQNPSYKSAQRLIAELVDIVSKNGCLLLNIPPKANGEIPAPVKERLLDMGRWLKLNGEAIYGTRPWAVFGEGPTQVQQGHFGEEKTKDFTAQDIRFTTKGKAIYAICLGWPGEKLVIKSLASNSRHFRGQIAAMELLGSRAELRWSRAEDGLTVFFPAEKPCQHAYVLKISPQ